MEESRERDEGKLNGDVKLHTPFTERLENYWYHYKWHTIVAVFVLVVLLVVGLQMCSKESYDAYVLYAGDKELERDSKNGEIPLYNTVLSSLGRVAEDYNGDGETLISLTTLLALTSEQIKDAENNPDLEVNYGLLQSDRQTLEDRMLYSEYYVCLLSPEVYEDFKTVNDVRIFANLAPYAPESSSLEYYSESAIKLSSTDFYKLPGISQLPEDTLICLRLSSAVADAFGGEKNAENFKHAEDIVRNMLSYKAK